MAEVTCSRCGNDAAGLERAPFPGPLGEGVLTQTCAACWKEWLATQVILINENKLNGANPEHVDFLMAQLRTFLNLQPEE